MSKLTALHINLIGVGTALVLSLILYFVLIKPRNEEVQTTKTTTEGIRSSGGTQAAVDGKKRDLAAKIVEVKQTQEAWAVNEEKYMPRIGFGTTDMLLPTYENKLISLPTYFGERLTAWYEAQRDERVSRLPGVEFPIESFPTDPNAISSLTSLKFPMRDKWQVQMEAKDFDAAMAHLSRFNNLRGLGMPVVNNVALQGTSPNLLLSYDLALYIIPRQPPPPSDPRLTGAANAAGAGAGGGGFGGGARPGFGGSPGGGMPGSGVPQMPGSGAPTMSTPSGIASPATRAGGARDK
jgi:hypothetical protein